MRHYTLQIRDKNYCNQFCMVSYRFCYNKCARIVMNVMLITTFLSYFLVFVRKVHSVYPACVHIIALAVSLCKSEFQRTIVFRVESLRANLHAWQRELKL